MGKQLSGLIVCCHLPQSGLVLGLLLNIIIKIPFALRIISVSVTFSTVIILILSDCLTRH